MVVQNHYLWDYGFSHVLGDRYDAGMAGMNDLTIYKLQRSIAGSHEPTMLIYNEDGSQEWMGPLSDEVKAFMGGRFKMYVYGNLEADGKVGIEGDMEAPEQDW